MPLTECLLEPIDELACVFPFPPLHLSNVMKPLLLMDVKSPNLLLEWAEGFAVTLFGIIGIELLLCGGKESGCHWCFPAVVLLPSEVCLLWLLQFDVIFVAENH